MKKQQLTQLLTALSVAFTAMQGVVSAGRNAPRKVRNPRTTPQMGQRVQLANAVNMYRLLSGFLQKGAFQSMPKGAIGITSF